MTKHPVAIYSDGTAHGTRVEVDGRTISGVTQIEFDPILPDGIVTAKITVVVGLASITASADVVAEVKP